MFGQSQMQCHRGSRTLMIQSELLLQHQPHLRALGGTCNIERVEIDYKVKGFMELFVETDLCELS